MKRQMNALVTSTAVLAAIFIATPAFAGPPLLCHPFEIGTARSLPWEGTWSQGKADYKIANLITDTETLLTPTTPVLVRMETLRRAALLRKHEWSNCQPAAEPAACARERVRNRRTT